MPPKGLVKRISDALRDAGLDRDVCFESSVQISGEWNYNRVELDYEKRFSPVYKKERTVRQQHKTLEETLCPQPIASKTLLKLLRWIDRVDEASKTGAARPAFEDLEGDGYIFPPDGHPDERWWLTEVSIRMEEAKLAQQADEDGPPSETDDSGLDSDENNFEHIDEKDLGKEVLADSSDEEERTQDSNRAPLLPTDRARYFEATTSSWSQLHDTNDASLPSSSSQ